MIACVIRRSVWALALALFFLGEAYAAKPVDPRSRSDFYRQSFGEVDPASFPLAQRVQSVFERLLRVADKAEYKAPDLLLVDSDNWPWAIALPDNTVVITRGAVEVCYQGVDTRQGDVRLAMILGHELGHLAEDDYWHRDVYLTLSDHAGDKASDVLRFIGERSGLIGSDSGEWRTIVRDRELRADDRGFIYSALAGYDPSLLVTGEAVSFFHYWTERTSIGPGSYHLRPEDRAAYIQARSGMLGELAELYRLGVALTYLGNLDAAESVFRQVLATFPAHEVYNNLGYIRLQKALEFLTVDVDRLFWFPSTVDTSPESAALTFSKTRNIQTLNGLLTEAVEFFRLAIRQDPGYLGAYLNLSTAYFYLQKYNSAAAVLADARQVAPGNTEIEVLWQISMLASLEGSVDYLPVALSHVESLANGAGSGPLLQYNLAQLLERAGRKPEADRLWQQLAAHGAAIPEPYRLVLDFRLGRSSKPETEMARSVDRTMANVFAPLLNAENPSDAVPRAFSLRLDNQPLVRIGADTGYPVRYLLGEYEILRRVTPATALPISDLLGCCGTPLSRQQSALGEVWRYGDRWAVLVQDGGIAEIWENTAITN